mgnify:CR=1 FL=1
MKGAADFEKSTLESVINARAKATAVNIDPSNITPEQLQQFNQAQSGLSSALSRLLVTVERYPDLKANTNFIQLQNEISDVENKLAAVRRYFNSSTKEFNNAVETFPSNIVAGMFNFKTETKNKELLNKILETQLQIKDQELQYLKKQCNQE